MARSTTTSKFTAKAKTTVVQPAEQVTAEPPKTTRFAALQQEFEELGIKLPSSTRTLISLVATFLTSFTTSYIGFSVVAWLSTAALVYSGSAFLGLLVLVVGYIVTGLVVFKASLAVGNFVLGFEFDDVRSAAASVQDAAQRRVSLVRGWFTRSSERVRAGSYPWNDTPAAATAA